MAVLSEDLREWLGQGLPGTVTTAGGDLQPESVRLWAVRVLERQDALELYVLAESTRFLASLAEGKRVAANLIEVPSYRSRTFKGSCAIAEGRGDASFLEERIAAMSRALASVGMPADAVERMLAHYESPRSMVVLGLEVESVFDQSPKRGAGGRL